MPPARKTGVSVRSFFAITIAACLCLLTACSPFTGSASDGSALQIVVSPHPDDDLEGMSAVDSSNHVVWLLATRGEAVGRCEPDWPEPRPPAGKLETWPVPEPDGRFTDTCTQARTNSWLGFHRDYSRLQGRGGFGAEGSELPKLENIPLSDLPGRDRPSNANTDGGQASSVAFLSGEHATLVAFDAGDKDLTPDEVEYMVDWVMAERGEGIPDLPLESVIGASYYNNPDATGNEFDSCLPALCSGDAAWAVYGHMDHLAVNLALARTDFGASDGNLVATWPRQDISVRDLAIGEDEYCALMCPPGFADAREVGLMQSWYAWLAFPGDFWPPTEQAVDHPSGSPLLMSRLQQFVVYFGQDSPAGQDVQL